MSSRVKGFTFLEVLAVVAVVAIVFAVATSNFTSSKSRLSNASYQITRDIQTLYNESIKSGKIHRLKLNKETDGYTLESFEFPEAKPDASDPDNREKLEKWEAKQRDLEESWKGKDKAELTRLDRGYFKEVKKRGLPFWVKIKKFITAQSLQDENRNEEVSPSILFYPSGEVDQALIVIEDNSEKRYSLVVQPLSGRVKTISNEIALEDWKKEMGLK